MWFFEFDRKKENILNLKIWLRKKTCAKSGKYVSFLSNKFNKLTQETRMRRFRSKKKSRKKSKIKKERVNLLKKGIKNNKCQMVIELFLRLKLRIYKNKLSL